jgi:excisionase family DNA binding protein
MPVSEPLLTAKEAAEELNITEEQVRRFVRDGMLTYINVGRGEKRPRMRFDRSTDIEQFKQKQRSKEMRPCPASTKTRSHRSTKPTSGSEVVSFLAQQARLRRTRHGVEREK